MYPQVYNLFIVSSYVSTPCKASNNIYFLYCDQLLLAAKHLLLEIDTLYLEVKDVQGPWNNLRGLSYGDDGTLFVGDIEVDTIDR